MQSNIHSCNKISILPFMAPISNMQFPTHTYKQWVLLILFICNKTFFFFCFCHCYSSRMPQAWESAHFIIQRLPLLNFCFLQCPLPLKARDYLNAFPPTGRVAHSFPWGYGAQYCVSVCCRTAGLAPSAADQGGHFHDILLHRCPQREGLVVPSRASLSLNISTRMYDQSAQSARMKYTSLTGRPPGSKNYKLPLVIYVLST